MARASEQNETPGVHLERLALMLEYAMRDLEIKRMAVTGASEADFNAKVIATADFLTANRGRGLFALREGDNHECMLRLYGRERDDR